MSALTDNILDHLKALVAVDTQNPPRAVTADGPLVQTVRDRLPGFDIKVHDYGGGSIVIEAIRGDAPVLFNVHLDTVPVAEGWQSDPHTLKVTNGRVYGLGACDIKGAAACLFALASRTTAPMHLVLSTDEESGQSACIRRYLEVPPPVRQAIIAEPTSVRAVTEHRGILSAKMAFTGTSGHSSGEKAKSAVHDAARWITAVLDHPEAAKNRLNVGRIEGGVKPNMIAASAELLFGFRALPGTDHLALLEAFDSAASDIVDAERMIRFVGPALPDDVDGPAGFAQAQATQWLDEVGLEKGEAVNFWTEAALFAAAGVPAIVLGPGDIAQAHTANEWVTIEQLELAYSAYERIVNHG
ncbi:acetylornithine deacetylase [Parvularcula sp. LCG005]|uniref:acetylornithine deacetylase n=1 Tax=Parvularcula sp. LCG005 TaxID=3078805 RepID=UPI002942EC1E|nr:acetylornithine deacetylase [Parvularcula sp. LCG005]WOI53060.1 acetylornithine deacetylase [Parvularcula sp. LCG005]